MTNHNVHPSTKTHKYQLEDVFKELTVTMPFQAH